MDLSTNRSNLRITGNENSANCGVSEVTIACETGIWSSILPDAVEWQLLDATGVLGRERGKFPFLYARRRVSIVGIVSRGWVLMLVGIPIRICLNIWVCWDEMGIVRVEGRELRIEKLKSRYGK